MSALSPDRLRLVVPLRPTSVNGRRPLRAPERFLKGPVPMGWLTKAAELKGKALAVGIWLWHLHGMERRQEVRLNLSRIASRGLSRYAAARGLAGLEAAGLVRARRGKGSAAMVTILSTSAKETAT